MTDSFQSTYDMPRHNRFVVAGRSDEEEDEDEDEDEDDDDSFLCIKGDISADATAASAPSASVIVREILVPDRSFG
jgi:hypothetical protein